MKKLCCLSVSLLVFAFSTAALDIYIAPFYFIDEINETADPGNNYHKRLLNELNSVETGLELRFRETAATSNPPQTVSDAISVSRSAQAEYLLYGFIAQKEYTLQAEIRLFDYQKRAVSAYFFSMDSKDNADRLIKDLARKIIEYVEINYHIQITTEKPAEFSHFSVLGRLGYWSPLDSNWIKILIGTVNIGGGIKFIPTDRAFIGKGYVFYISTGVEAGYRLGAGNLYDAWDHSVSIYSPVRLHMKLTGQNEVFVGTGFSYSLDFLNIKKPYENPEVVTYDEFGVFFDVGYQFRLKDTVLLFSEGRFELRFYQTPMFSFSPSIGIEYRFKTREVKYK
jgi:hypothetical protein